jgi:hypothetical protein
MGESARREFEAKYDRRVALAQWDSLLASLGAA